MNISARAFNSPCLACSSKYTCMPYELITKLQEKKPGQSDNISPTSNHIFLKSNSVLFHQGDPFHSIFMIKSGCIKILSVDEDGEESLDGIYFPGEFIGLNSISSNSYNHYAITASNSIVCKIPYRNLEKVSEAEPSLSTHFIGAVSDQLSREIIWRRFVTKSTMKDRLIGFLLDVSEKFELESESNDSFKLPISLQETSYLLDMRKETLSRQIKELNNSNLIQINKRTVTIKDRDKLKLMLDRKLTLPKNKKKHANPKQGSFN